MQGHIWIVKGDGKRYLNSVAVQEGAQSQLKWVGEGPNNLEMLRTKASPLCQTLSRGFLQNNTSLEYNFQKSGFFLPIRSWESVMLRTAHGRQLGPAFCYIPKNWTQSSVSHPGFSWTPLLLPQHGAVSLSGNFWVQSSAAGWGS